MSHKPLYVNIRKYKFSVTMIPWIYQIVVSLFWYVSQPLSICGRWSHTDLGIKFQFLDSTSCYLFSFCESYIEFVLFYICLLDGEGKLIPTCRNFVQIWCLYKNKKTMEFWCFVYLIETLRSENQQTASIMASNFSKIHWRQSEKHICEK